MKTNSNKLMKFNLHVNLLIFSCFCISASAIDTMKANESLSVSQALFSNGNRFKLGFFSPPNSSVRYVGIMYNLPVMTVVWVANRNSPLIDGMETFELSSSGNLVILDGRKEIVWSTNVSASVVNASAVLLDTGNLVMYDSSNNMYWESFNHASDSWLEQMKILTDLSRNERNVLTSWKSRDDPTPGSFSLTIEPLDIPQSFILKDGYPYSRSGPWNGQIFTGVPHMQAYYKFGPNVVLDSPGRAYFVYSLPNSLMYVYSILTSWGDMERKEWSDEKKQWNVTWTLLRSVCDLYAKCGPFGSCNAHSRPICSCFHGFMPKNRGEWEAGNWTSGCMRRTSLQCDQNSTSDEFLKVGRVKVPDHFRWLPSLEGGDCRATCLSNCSCLAYSNPSRIGCLHWGTESLIDVQEFSVYGGDDMYIRLASSELGKKHDRRIVIATTVVLGFILVAVCAILLNYRARKNRYRLSSSNTTATDAEYSEEAALRHDKHGVKLEELPFFKLQMLSNATENFDPVNKLGQGGFGPVYKGTLPNGQEIAVKRLARSSNQGAEEFMNEVEVISRLQHRNLVRLLGCCVESEEKMLVYEYMPNGSLDAYLFSSHKREFLDWPTRKLIIEGICRGLLYLHRDSRLKIIHRDLKASNILLDEELYPKISDFGMARIFGSKSDEANTNRVVGTFGYMSPEYALQGLFSEKSDVYSFGVLLLEIVSGKKNSGVYDAEQHLFLISYAWKLWDEGQIITLMDPSIYDDGIEGDIVRYANVGLLCVQEVAADRPSISTVLSMLSCDIVDLPCPKQPAFLTMQISRGIESSIESSGKGSINNVSISVIEGR